MKEFTVFPPKEKKENSQQSNNAEDILLLLREDGHFVQYGNEKSKDDPNQVIEGTSSLGTMKGSWALVDGNLILAADRSEDTANIRSDGKKHDTILTGQVKATSGLKLLDNPALIEKQGDEHENDNSKTSSTPPSAKEDVHLSVSGEITIGKFFYPQKHPSFFEQPMVDGTATGSFELKQILGSLNTKVDKENEFVERFKKRDLIKRYFLTSYPLPTRREKRQRWSIKYNAYVDDKPDSEAEKEREEMEKNAPMQIKSFEVELFANNTFSTITGLGDTVLRGKWSIVGEESDQFWMSVWRFGFGRSVSGSTFSEGSQLKEEDDVSYWGKIYELDAAREEDSIEDDPNEWKGTKIEINGAVMLGVGLEPCSIARFTMIEKTEADYDDDEDDEPWDELPLLDDASGETGDDDLSLLDDGIGSFE